MKIGFFDSGAGGLTVLLEFLKILKIDSIEKDIIKNIKITYLADLINAPYGQKDNATLLNIIHSNIDTLKYDYDCDYIISACNSASAIYNETNNYTEMIGPTATFCHENNYKNNLLFATEATINSRVYEKEFGAYNLKVTSASLPLLATFIEEGKREVEIEVYIKTEIQKIKNIAKCDSVIIGCTHYPFVEHIFKKYINAQILNPSIFAASHAFYNIKDSIKNAEKCRSQKEDSKEINSVEIDFILNKENIYFREKVKKYFSNYITNIKFISKNTDFVL